MLLEIKEPCKADWQKMTPHADGRYCAQCDKVVKDFTQMNDAQVYDFVKQNRDTCGRFSQLQLNRPLLPQPTLNYKWYGRAAAGTLLMSAFFPNNLKSQTQDSSAVPIATNFTVNTNVFSSSVMNGSVVQPDSAGKRIQQIEFSIDTFRLVIDLNTNNAFSFQVPGQYVGDSINVELRLADASTQTLKIGGTNTFMNAWHYRSSLCFVYYKERWTSQIVGQPVLDVISLGGIYPQYEIKPIKIDWPNTLTLGYTISNDSNLQLVSDTNALPMRHENFEYIQIKSNKPNSKSSSWLWFLLIGLAGLVVAFLKFKKPRKPMENESTEQETNTDSESGQ